MIFWSKIAIKLTNKTESNFRQLSHEIESSLKKVNIKDIKDSKYWNKNRNNLYKFSLVQ